MTKTFDSAIFARGGKPLSFIFRTYLLDEDGEPTEVDDAGEPKPHPMKLVFNPGLDIMQVATALSALSAVAKDMKGLSSQNDDDDGEVELDDADAVEALEALAGIEDAIANARAGFRACLVGQSRARFDQVADQFSFELLMEAMQWLMGELQGEDDTKPKSSQTESSDSGQTSTDGVPVEESTPAPSDTVEP